MEKTPTDVGGPISQAFLAVDVASNGAAQPVPAIDGLLPLGMPADTAVAIFRTTASTAGRSRVARSCLRTLHHGSSSESWTVNLTFGADGGVASRSGTTQAKSL